MITNLHGIKVAYDDQGHGACILFIHGFPLSRKLWDPQIEFFSNHNRIITPDLRGHGETQAVPGPYTMEILAKDCHALLEYLSITSPVYLCGLSMGGYISLAFYRLYPKNVAGLILAATRANADTPDAQENRDKAICLAIQQGSLAIAESMLPKMLAPDSYHNHPALLQDLKEMMVKTSISGLTGALHGMKNRQDSSSLLPLISVPTLIIHGVNDQLIPLYVAQDMASAIPGAKFKAITNAGHLLNLEQPAIFNQAVYNFIFEQD